MPLNISGSKIDYLLIVLDRWSAFRRGARIDAAEQRAGGKLSGRRGMLAENEYSGKR